jgi:hypothetical protein
MSPLVTSWHFAHALTGLQRALTNTILSFMRRRMTDDMCNPSMPRFLGSHATIDVKGAETNTCIDCTGVLISALHQPLPDIPVPTPTPKKHLQIATIVVAFSGMLKCQDVSRRHSTTRKPDLSRATAGHRFLLLALLASCRRLHAPRI